CVRFLLVPHPMLSYSCTLSLHDALPISLQEAVSAGADEALLLDPEGYVAEGSGENVFIVKNGVIYTPEVTACLNGITRATILTLARELGLEIVEKRITRDEVYIADE